MFTLVWSLVLTWCYSCCRMLLHCDFAAHWFMCAMRCYIVNVLHDKSAVSFPFEKAHNGFSKCNLWGMKTHRTRIIGRDICLIRAQIKSDVIQIHPPDANQLRFFSSCVSVCLIRIQIYSKHFRIKSFQFVKMIFVLCASIYLRTVYFIWACVRACDHVSVCVLHFFYWWYPRWIEQFQQTTLLFPLSDPIAISIQA